MTIKVKYLPEAVIEGAAHTILTTYYDEIGEPVRPPIPVDDILEGHLNLRLDFDDLKAILGVADVLGALWVDTREVFIDESLDPAQHPEMEGRYHFSVAHEIGHWILHRHYLSVKDPQAIMFRNDESVPSVVCRSSRAKEPIEWQADHFASSLLMPRDLVYNAWEERFNVREPYIFRQRHWRDLSHRLNRPRMRRIGMVLWDMFEPRPTTVRYVFREVAKHFAPKFSVSAQAMQIRLEHLGLLHLEDSVGRDLSAAV